MAVIPSAERQTLLFDDFSSPLSRSTWDFNEFSTGGSFYGRTQQRQSLPSTSGGLLHLQLDSFNPTARTPGDSFVGSEIISNQTFSAGASGIAFETSFRVTSAVPGLVGGLFLYSANPHNEVDFESLGNDASAGRNREETNVYANEPLGAGNPEFVPVNDLTKFHTYRIELYPDRVRWFIDGQLVRETTDHVPQGPMSVHLNIWAPTSDFSDAYAASLQTATTAAADTTYIVDADYVRVASLASGSRLAFYSGAVTPDKVNVVLTADGSDVTGKAITGDFNVEVFTSTPGALAAGFNASTFVQGAVRLTNNAIQAGTPTSTEQLLDGSYTLIDLAGGDTFGQAIQIIGSKTGGVDVVVGSAGDTISGSANSAVAQIVDASGTNTSANPGPSTGPETVIGGAGQTTVWGAKGDSIAGGAGALQVNDATLGGAETIKGGAGNLTIFSIGKSFSITGATAGTTFINDLYGGGGGSSIVGGSGTGLFSVGTASTGANTIVFAAPGDKVTVGSALSYVDASKGSITVQGGSGTVPGAPVGASGFNTAILAGKSDQIALGAAPTFVDALALASTGTTVTGGGGLDVVLAGAGVSIIGGKGELDAAPIGGSGTITGGAGNLLVFDIGKGETITGSTGGTTFIDDGYGVGGNSKLTGGTGSGTFNVTFGKATVGINSAIVGAAGDTITGGTGPSYLNGIFGNQSIIGGVGAVTVQAAIGDTVTGGTGTMVVFLDSTQATTTVNLGAGHGVTTLRDNPVSGGKGDTVSVSGFATVTDVIASSSSVDAGGKFLGTSASDGKGGTILTFIDSSTMTLAGVSDPTKIKFTT